MPRLVPSLFRKARRLSPHIATLLPACRDIGTAQNELRWIKEHIDEAYQNYDDALLEKLCRRRGRGVPLQYVLGSQPFGSLDIKCRPGVLIPRPETEAYTCHLVELIRSGKLLGNSYRNGERELGIIDFCTGTGCIPLLLFSALQTHVRNLRVQGVDISPRAVQLAKWNITCNDILNSPNKADDRKELAIVQGDVFNDEDIAAWSALEWDVLVSNPPYISSDIWNHGRGQLGYSVRKYEPRLALIPNELLPKPEYCNPEDVFYARLLDVAWTLKAKVVLLEVGDENQARRVLQLYYQHTIAGSTSVELWRDWPADRSNHDDEPVLNFQINDGHYRRVPIRGNGLVRSVFIKKL